MGLNYGPLVEFFSLRSSHKITAVKFHAANIYSEVPNKRVTFSPASLAWACWEKCNTLIRNFRVRQSLWEGRNLISLRPLIEIGNNVSENLRKAAVLPDLLMFTPLLNKIE